MDECAICIDRIERGEQQSLKCGHYFHKKCIDEWLTQKNECPICRSLESEPQPHPAPETAIVERTDTCTEIIQTLVLFQTFINIMFWIMNSYSNTYIFLWCCTGLLPYFSQPVLVVLKVSGALSVILCCLNLTVNYSLLDTCQLLGLLTQLQLVHYLGNAVVREQ